MIHVIIDYVFNELTYDFKINDILKFLIDLSTENYNQFREVKRKNVEIVMTFVVVFSKTRYDVVHQIMNIQINDKIYFRLHQRYTISSLVNHKLSNQKVSFFEMLKKIDHFAFRLQLFSIMKIHSIIFITQLKSTIKKSNSYNRVINSKSSSVKKKEFNLAFHYEIKRLLNKKTTTRKKVQYLVK